MSITERKGQLSGDIDDRQEVQQLFANLRASLPTLARYFLEMAVRYGKELQQPPRRLASGWAALLYLYNLR